MWVVGGVKPFRLEVPASAVPLYLQWHPEVHDFSLFEQSRCPPAETAACPCITYHVCSRVRRRTLVECPGTCGTDERRGLDVRDCGERGEGAPRGPPRDASRHQCPKLGQAGRIDYVTDGCLSEKHRLGEYRGWHEVRFLNAHIICREVGAGMRF